MVSERTKRTARRMGAFAKSAFEVLYRSGVGLSGVNVVIATVLLCPYVCGIVQDIVARVPEVNGVTIAPAVFVFGGVALGMTIFFYGLFGKLPEWDFGEDPEPRQRDLSWIVVADDHAIVKFEMPELKRAMKLLAKISGAILVAVLVALSVATWKGADDALLVLWPALIGLGAFGGLLGAAASLYEDVREKARRDARQQSDS